MPEIPFTDDDIDNLGRKLTDLGLEGTERALMNAVLALAANRLRDIPTPPEQIVQSNIVSDLELADLPDPGEQLKPALTPQTPDLRTPLASLGVRGSTIPLRPPG